MIAQELYDQYRGETVDFADPPLWSSTEVFRYMKDAYSMFVRLTGGIADITSDLTRVPIVLGEATAKLDPRILRIMEAYRVSDEVPIEIINQTNLTFQRDNDYGRSRPIYRDSTPGPVKYMIIGAQRNLVKWVQVPIIDDEAQLSVYRLPIDNIDPASPDFDFDFSEIGEEHHTHLCLWMKHLGYAKADAETFDKGKSDSYRTLFVAYCAEAKAEWERYKHKNRQVSYGGI